MESSLDILTAVLRLLLYAGTIMAAGSAFFALSFPRAAPDAEPVIFKQAWIGAALVLVTELLRYVVFQLSIAGGDPVLAFGQDLRWMAFEVPAGWAALVRMAGVAMILLSLRKFRVFAVTAAFAVAASYALEGHTAAMENTRWLNAILLLHVVAVHWWLGGLWPLAAATRTQDSSSRAAAVTRFSRLAVPVFGVLLIAGAVVLVTLSDWKLEPALPYQQLFAAKLILVTAIACLAAHNRFKLTPRIEDQNEGAVVGLRRSIRWEGMLAVLVLVSTAFIVMASPKVGS